MRNRNRDDAGTSRLPLAGWLAATVGALALLLSSSPAAAAATAASVAFERHEAAQLDHAHEDGVGTEIAQNRRGRGDPKPPPRGSSAEIHGGSSADRYGGSSADRRGVAGRYDPRNRGVRQFTGNNRKRNEERPKRDDEPDDQDEDPPRDRFSFTPPDPSIGSGRGGRD